MIDFFSEGLEEIQSHSARTTLATPIVTISTPVKSAMQYFNKGKRRQQAVKARVESNTTLEDSGAVALQQHQWK